MSPPPERASVPREVPITVNASSADDHSSETVSRGIRSIPAPARTRSRIDSDIRETAPVGAGLPPRRPSTFSRLWIWAAASIVLLVAVGALVFAFGSTVVTVTPKSETLALDGATIFTAERYNAALSNATGTLTYATETFDLEDSEAVPAQGTTHVETKANGSIAVYNEYSTTPIRLVKNTRFEAGGLIYRAVSDIVIPAKKGTTAGRVNVMVIADQAGEKYNIGPTARFTIPGLAGNSAMFKAIYASSETAFTGGFSGDQPGTAPGALESAIAQVRSRLEAKAHETALAQTKDGTIVFPELVSITYQSLANTAEAGGAVRVHEKASVEVPVFDVKTFSTIVASSAGVAAAEVPVTLKPLEGFAVRAATSTDAESPDSLRFSLTGPAVVVWDIDVSALTGALAGKDRGAFQTIVNGFSGVEEAHARIAPFWRSTFPGEALDIKVEVITPEAAQ